MRKLTDKEVSFRISVEQDDLEVRGNAMCSGDDDFDLECENDILRRLDRGDYTAWCYVKVTASWNGFEGFAGIGACSFAEDANEQIEAHQIATDYDLAGDALADLNEKIKAHLSRAESIADKLR
jgi:hypothetical protein